MFEQLENFYHIDYTVISLVFLAPFIGYALAALLNNKIHMRFGQLGVACTAPACKLVAYIVSTIPGADFLHSNVSGDV
jgi:hypothetical protein